MLTPRNNLEKSDAIVVLTGNGWERTDWGVELLEKNMAPFIVLAGTTGSRPCWDMKRRAISMGVPKDKIILETKSTNTKQNAREILKLAEQYGWQKIILADSQPHQLRAHLTFKKTKKETGSKVEIINYPPTDYGWWDIVESSRNTKKRYFRWILLIAELCKIAKYHIKGVL